MYDQSLEQLIDAVIADGVITDKERNAVLKKAASLGIDQDEIEVYLDGRLDKLNNGKPKSNKHGGIRLCPNCGANLGSFTGRCPECGHEVSGVESNSTVKALQRQLEAIDAENKNQSTTGKAMSAMASHFGGSSTGKRKVQLITNFAIPNTKEDLLEFATLCLTNLSASAVTSDDQLIYSAWKAKSKQIIAKAETLFPNDSDVTNIISKLRGKSNKMSPNAKMGIIIGVICVIVFGGIIFFGVSHENNEAREIEEYTTEMCERINNIPTPTTDNYVDCYRKFSAIKWTKDKKYRWEESYNTFCEAQESYKDLLYATYKKAGVPESEIPEGIKPSSSSSSGSSMSSQSTSQEEALPEEDLATDLTESESTTSESEL